MKSSSKKKAQYKPRAVSYNRAAKASDRRVKRTSSGSVEVIFRPPAVLEKVKDAAKLAGVNTTKFIVDATLWRIAQGESRDEPKPGPVPVEPIAI